MQDRNCKTNPSPALQRSAWINDIGIPTLNDHGAGGNNVGCAFIPQNSDPLNVTRSTARTGYYDPVATRTNLHLLVKHYVSKIQFNGTTAVGVNIVDRADNSIASVAANQEVILAAGALQTPRILQLSGVGPSGVLNNLGIPVVAALPGVGANYQDHPWVLTGFVC